MTQTTCPALEHELLAYWLGELDETQEQRLDEHLMVCGACSERMRAIVDLGAAIRHELLDGSIDVVLPAAYVRRIKAAGLRVREYDLEPGGTVNCTVTRDDDLVVAYLRAPLQGVRRLDVVIDDAASGMARANDVAFDPEADNVTLVPSVAHLRTLGHGHQRVRLVAVEGNDEREIADYTFKHYPSR